MTPARFQTPDRPSIVPALRPKKAPARDSAAPRLERSQPSASATAPVSAQHHPQDFADNIPSPPAHRASTRNNPASADPPDIRTAAHQHSAASIAAAYPKESIDSPAQYHSQT